MGQLRLPPVAEDGATVGHELFGVHARTALTAATSTAKARTFTGPECVKGGECPENGGMTTQEVRSVGSIADRGNGDAMGVAVDCDRG